MIHRKGIGKNNVGSKSGGIHVSQEQQDTFMNPLLVGCLVFTYYNFLVEFRRMLDISKPHYCRIEGLEDDVNNPNGVFMTLRQIAPTWRDVNVRADGPTKNIIFDRSMLLEQLFPMTLRKVDLVFDSATAARNVLMSIQLRICEVRIHIRGIISSEDKIALKKCFFNIFHSEGNLTRINELDEDHITIKVKDGSGVFNFDWNYQYLSPYLKKKRNDFKKALYGGLQLIQWNGVLFRHVELHKASNQFQWKIELNSGPMVVISTGRWEDAE